MEAKTPLPKIEKHGLQIGALGQQKGLRMYETRMRIRLLFGHGSKSKSIEFDSGFYQEFL
jgi:hypothetical protein